MHFPRAAAIAASVSLASASAIRGFNSASTNADNSAKTQADFQAEFQNQKNLAGTNGQLNSCRLYTMIQADTTNSPISAIPAAIAEGTGLLLGLWGSAGQDNFNNELAALSSAIKQYGTAFASLVQGISVGSEDLYRISPTGIANSNGLPGADPAILASYISQTRKVLAGTSLSSALVGHVDTWTAWTNSSNSVLTDACDFLGVDEYPYYQSVNTNPIDNAQSLFYQAVEATSNAGGGKPVWITESGWPTTGPTVGEAVASVANARKYWLDVYCTLPASTPVYWYIQFDASTVDPAQFGVTGTSLSTSPLYPLNCNGATPYNPSSSASSSTASSTSAASSTQGSKSGSGSATATASGSSSTKGSSSGGSSSTTTGSTSSVTEIVGGVSTTMKTSTPASTSSVYFPIQSTNNATSVTSTGMGTGTGVPLATATPSASINSGSNTQIYTLALLIVPALLALLA